MRRSTLGLALAALIAGPATAQNSTAELLQQAHQSYEQVDIERALLLLRQVVSPSWPFEVTAEQRVDAYKYLGAALALRGQGDSAVLYFRAALERDAFTDLDPATFTPVQLGMFAQARRLTFAVAARPVADRRVDPRTERVPFTVVATHSATLDVRLSSVGVLAPVGVTLFSAVSEGLREIDWNGLLADGRLAPPGRYELLVVGQSRLRSTRDTARTYFDLAYDREPLEDTLPALGPGQLLSEQVTDAAARADLLKALGVAAAAVVISDHLTSRDLGRGMPSASRALAGVAVLTGGISLVYRRRHRDLPENVAENARRRAERLARNDAILRRNQERIARTVLVIAPAAGIGSPP